MNRPATDATRLAELAAPLSPREQAIGGCARGPHFHRTTGTPTPGAVLSLYRLLVYVSGETAPDPVIIAGWRARDRAMARLWGERELARKVTGADGCPPIAVPPALAAYWERS